MCSELLLEAFNAEHSGAWAACVATALVLWAAWLVPLAQNIRGPDVG